MRQIHAYIVQNDQTQRRYDLVAGVNKIGREADNLIVVRDDLRSLSRYHAEIHLTAEDCCLIDLNSSNGSYINQQRISRQNLENGDVIQFGDVSFNFFLELSSELSIELNTAEERVNSDLSIMTEIVPDSSRLEIRDLLSFKNDNSNKFDSHKSSSNKSVLMLKEEDVQQRNTNKLRILLEVTQQLSLLQSYELILNRILELLFEIMNVDRGVILMLNEHTQSLSPKAFKIRDRQESSFNFYSESIAQYVFNNGLAIISDNAKLDERFIGAQSVIIQAITATMCVPLKPSKKVIGVMYVDNLSIANLYTREDLEFLTSLANQAAIAIENFQLRQELQLEAIQRTRLERFFPLAVMQRLAEGDELEKIIETNVTALFCDISGFTELAAKMPPRQVLEMLNEYFNVMVEDIVFEYEGTLEKYIADALLAVWGSPYQREDDTIRAVKAAIGMQRAMISLNQIWVQTNRDLHIQIHIGLNSGKVAAGNIGSKKLIQYTNIGDTMNVASRICNVAKAGEILISESTLAQIKNFDIPVEPILPVLVKGKLEPLNLFRVLWQEFQ